MLFPLLSNRNVFLRKRQTTQVCVSTSVARSGSLTATAVASDGISPLMAQNARDQQLLMLWSTCGRGKVHRICFARVTSKESVRTSPKVLCELDSGLATAMALEMLMVIRAGTRCHGFTWKKCLPRKLEAKIANSSFFVFENSGSYIRIEAYTEILLNDIRRINYHVTFFEIHCNQLIKVANLS